MSHSNLMRFLTDRQQLSDMTRAPTMMSEPGHRDVPGPHGHHRAMMVLPGTILSDSEPGTRRES
jgi:hypothetical protein